MVTVTSDEQIVERALSGDAEAFGEIVHRWERRIFALAYGMLGREEDARDATQCITRQRRAKVRGETALEDETEADGASYSAPAHESPASAAESREKTVIVRRAVNALPTELRQVIVMKEFEELTFQEIADALDLPLSTVKSRLYTALRQLQMRLRNKIGRAH